MLGEAAYGDESGLTDNCDERALARRKKFPSRHPCSLVHALIFPLNQFPFFSFSLNVIGCWFVSTCFSSFRTAKLFVRVRARTCHMCEYILYDTHNIVTVFIVVCVCVCARLWRAPFTPYSPFFPYAGLHTSSSDKTDRYFLSSAF